MHRVVWVYVVGGLTQYRMRVVCIGVLGHRYLLFPAFEGFKATGAGLVVISCKGWW